MGTGLESKAGAHKPISRTLANGASFRLAVARTQGTRLPELVWFNGFKSDMSGTKATALAQWAVAHGASLTRFDHMGHGASGGAFVDGNISIWRDDGLAVLDAVTTGDLVLVGSSMGAWIATLCALARPTRVKGLILIAPALDFTERLMWQSFDDATRRTIMETGVWHRPSIYGPDPYPITRQLIEDGRRHLMLDAPIGFAGKVHILQGMRDPDVPYDHALKTARQFAAAGLAMDLVADGDHRLSRPHDIAHLVHVVEGMCR